MSEATVCRVILRELNSSRDETCPHLSAQKVTVIDWTKVDESRRMFALWSRKKQTDRLRLQMLWETGSVSHSQMRTLDRKLTTQAEELVKQEDEVSLIINSSTRLGQMKCTVCVGVKLALSDISISWTSMSAGLSRLYPWHPAHHFQVYQTYTRSWTPAVWPYTQKFEAETHGSVKHQLSLSLENDRKNNLAEQTACFTKFWCWELHCWLHLVSTVQQPCVRVRHVKINKMWKSNLRYHSKDWHILFF